MNINLSFKKFGMKKVSLLFKWYDLWIGIFWDKKTHTFYIFPIPMFGIAIFFGGHCKWCNKSKKKIDMYTKLNGGHCKQCEKNPVGIS